MERTTNKKNGITLVALVITIIILLILAGITLGFVFGKNGIIGMAEKAGKNYVTAEKEEEKTLNELYSSMQIATNDSSMIHISVEELQTLINKTVEEKLAQSSSGTGPTGTVISYMGNTAPEGYLPCDGTAYNIADYPNLSTQIQEQFGSVSYFGGDGETTFAVPNLKGEFLRGTGTNDHTKQGNGANVGVHQDATQHTAIVADGTGGTNTNMYVRIDNSGTGGYYPRGFDSVIKGWALQRSYGSNGSINNSNNSMPGLYTSRPTNTSVLYCIKY